MFFCFCFCFVVVVVLLRDFSPRCLDTHPHSPRLNQSEGPAILEHYVCPNGASFEFIANGSKAYYSNDSYNQGTCSMGHGT